jgi:hypothetical protein
VARSDVDERLQDLKSIKNILKLEDGQEKNGRCKSEGWGLALALGSGVTIAMGQLAVEIGSVQ